MLQAIYSIRYFFEKRGFYVSSRLAERLGMRAKSVRLFFIYVSFATLGAGFAIYLTLAFILRLKDLVNTKRTSVFDL
ncbi:MULTISPECIES: PspC domain-containing protein [Aequorivita]|uniref:PspC domain-containing protein n=2 Tax=Aequorivita TaxID=153265 RepID=A0AB35YVP8_9FLAO|nr:PspC domain-containing protein [Aequorivita sp. Ant34-E75]WGF94138.1 PspC domain-containing protein [Aequorivita sp. Ant34-E75]